MIWNIIICFSFLHDKPTTMPSNLCWQAFSRIFREQNLGSWKQFKLCKKGANSVRMRRRYKTTPMLWYFKKLYCLSVYLFAASHKRSCIFNIIKHSMSLPTIIFTTFATIQPNGCAQDRGRQVTAVKRRVNAHSGSLSETSFICLYNFFGRPDGRVGLIFTLHRLWTQTIQFQQTNKQT